MDNQSAVRTPRRPIEELTYVIVTADFRSILDRSISSSIFLLWALHSPVAIDPDRIFECVDRSS
jgi:hypothetical protein